MWHVSSYEDVKQGRVTDVYFQRTRQGCSRDGA